MRELEALFEKHDFNSFPVVEKGKTLGIVTKFDFLRAFAFTIGQMVPHYDELMRRPVGEMMTGWSSDDYTWTPRPRKWRMVIRKNGRASLAFYLEPGRLPPWPAPS